MQFTSGLSAYLLPALMYVRICVPVLLHLQFNVGSEKQRYKFSAILKQKMLGVENTHLLIASWGVVTARRLKKLCHPIIPCQLATSAQEITYNFIEPR